MERERETERGGAGRRGGGGRREGKRGESEQRRSPFASSFLLAFLVLVAAPLTLLPPVTPLPPHQDLSRASDVCPIVARCSPSPSYSSSLLPAFAVVGGAPPSSVRGQRRRQRDELPELVVWGRHAGEGRAAEGAQGGSLLLAVAEDEGEAGDAALVFSFWVFFMTKRERAK
jgi:hypothetical protein